MNEILDRYRPRMIALVRRRAARGGSGNALHSDVVQDSLVEAVGQFDRFSMLDERAFYRWLARITVCNLRNQMQKERLRVARDIEDVPEPSTAAPAPAAQAAETDRAEAVRTVLATMPERERRLVELHAIEGWSFRAVAAELGYKNPVAAFRAYSEARALLAVRLARLRKDIEEP